jgi:hypothetical protein
MLLAVLFGFGKMSSCDQQPKEKEAKGESQP